VGLLVLTVVGVSAFAATNRIAPSSSANIRITKDPSFQHDDQWELATAADDSGHLYVLYPQLRSDSNCGNNQVSCGSANLTLVTSHDSGVHWEAARAVTSQGNGQTQPQIVVDSVDRKTVYATWLENNRRNVVAAKSSDFGQSWAVVLLSSADAVAEHPVLAARGADVYVGFTRGHSVWMASSHDGGVDFTATQVNAYAQLEVALAGSAAVDDEGNAYLAWSGYTAGSAAEKRVNLYMSRVPDHGGRWTTALMDSSREPVGCSDFHCPWGYLGAQITVAADTGGVVYALWNASPAQDTFFQSQSMQDQPERLYFASSTTHGETWSAKADISSAPDGASHALPVIIAGAAGVVRVAWMDSRHSPDWNTYYRTSTNGGASWSDEKQFSNHPLASLYAPESRSNVGH
jgi:hypothetical protein